MLKTANGVLIFDTIKSEEDVTKLLMGTSDFTYGKLIDKDIYEFATNNSIVILGYVNEQPVFARIETKTRYPREAYAVKHRSGGEVVDDTKYQYYLILKPMIERKYDYYIPSEFLGDSKMGYMHERSIDNG